MTSCLLLSLTMSKRAKLRWAQFLCPPELYSLLHCEREYRTASHKNDLRSQGRAPEAPGRAPQAPGRAVEAPGRAPEAPGRALEAPGRAPEAPGRAP